MKEESKKIPTFLTWVSLWLSKIVNARETGLCWANNACSLDITKRVNTGKANLGGANNTLGPIMLCLSNM